MSLLKSGKKSNWKKWTAMVLAFCMLLTSFPPVYAEENPDVEPPIIQLTDENIESSEDQEENHTINVNEAPEEPQLEDEHQIMMMNTLPKIDYIESATATAADRNGVILSANLSALTDGNPATQGMDFWGGHFTLDFGHGFGVLVSAFNVQARTNFANRFTGTHVLGSLDGVIWTEITVSRALGNQELQSLAVREADQSIPYRYLRVAGAGASPFNIGELSIIGSVIEMANLLESVSISTNNGTNIAVAGETITLDMKSTVPIDDVKFTINGKVYAAASGDEPLSWSASYTVEPYDYPGEVKFSVNYRDEQGIVGLMAEATTDGSAVLIAEKEDYLDLLQIAQAFGTVARNSNNEFYTDYGSSRGREQANLMLDKNSGTTPDYRDPNNQGWVYLAFDMGEGNAVSLDRSFAIARSTLPARLQGMHLQGSHNGTDWLTLSSSALNSTEWQALAITDKSSYRYIRVFNNANWFMNVAEMKFYGRHRQAGVIYVYDLKDQVSIAETIHAEGQVIPGTRHYSDESWLAFESAYQQATALLAAVESNPNNGRSQEELDEATSTLRAAIEGLTEKLPDIIDLGLEVANPGIMLNEADLNRIRDHIANKTEPWYSFYQSFKENPQASKSYSIRNDKHPGTDTLEPNYGYKNYHTGFFQHYLGIDATAAYYQAFMYYMTGDTDYRAKAIRILKLWSMIDPSEAGPVPDAHIHMPVTVMHMNAAVDLIRSTTTNDDSLLWTEADTERYMTNFMDPPLRLFFDNPGSYSYYFNQFQYALNGAMSSYILKGDLEAYHRMVEKAIVNRDNQGVYHQGAFTNAFMQINTNYDGTPLENDVIVIKEMHRDQPHSYDNINAFTSVSMMLRAQGTKLDPIAGTASTSEDAVSIFEFMDHRLLKGINHFIAYNFGNLVPFNDGKNSPPSRSARGRVHNVENMYYYYKYALGFQDNDPDFQYVARMFNTFRAHNRAFSSTDFHWAFIPDEAAGDMSLLHRPAAEPEGVQQFEIRYSGFDDKTSIRTEGETTYVEAKATPEGSRFAVFSIGQQNIAFRIRTDDVMEMDFRVDHNEEPFRTVFLPDTEGEWRFITINLNHEILFIDVRGKEGAIAGFDYMKALGTPDITPPVFSELNASMPIPAYVGGQLSTSFMAEDSNPSETVRYSLIFAPDGAAIDEEGQFTWTPEETGAYSFYVSATDGSAISLLEVTVDVQSNYEAAIAELAKVYDSSRPYEATSLEVYLASYDQAVAAVNGTLAEQNVQLHAFKAAVNGLRLVTPLAYDGSMDYRGLVTSKLNANQVNVLLDNDLMSSHGDLWGNDDKSFTIDFGPSYKVAVSEFQTGPRNMFPQRSEGVVALGSNDGVNWIRLTDLAVESLEMQSLPVYESYRDTKFRMFKFKDLNGGFLNPSETAVEDQPMSISELRIFGTRFEMMRLIDSVAIASSNLGSRANPGDTVTLNFTTTEDIAYPEVTIEGHHVPVVKAEGSHSYTATYTVPADVRTGPAAFTINYRSADGNTSGVEEVLTTDGSSVLLSNTGNLIEDVLGKAELVLSDSLRSGTPEMMFDNLVSHIEFGHRDSHMTFDFGKAGENYAVKLERIEMFARTGFANRLAGAFVQGSHDNETWSEITISGAQQTQQWQSLSVKVNDQRTPYRYIRVTKGGEWYGNISELRFFGEYGNDLSAEPEDTFSIQAKASIEAAGTLYINKGEHAIDESNLLDGVSYGDTVTVRAVPNDGYQFVKWTRKKMAEGLEVDYNISSNSVYTLGQYRGGYLGGGRILEVMEDWDLTAHFVKIETGIADLSGLELSHGNLSPAFRADVIDYTAKVANSVSGIRITAQAADPNAAFTINEKPAESANGVDIPLNVGLNTLVVQLTADNGTLKTYTIRITRESSSVTYPATPNLPQTEEAATVSGGTLTIKSQPDKDDRLSVELKEKDLLAILEKTKDRQIVLNVESDESPAAVTLHVPVTALLEGLGDGKVETIHFRSPLLNLSLAVDWLTEAAGKGDAKRLTILISSVKQSQLTGEAAKSVGNSPIYELRLEMDGVPLSNVQGHKAKVELSYSLIEGQHPDKIVAYVVDEQGKLKVVKSSRYDSQNGMLVFHLEHYGAYTAFEADVRFQDLTEVRWAENAILNLAARDIINGMSPEHFQPDAVVTRAQFAKLLVETLNLQITSEESGFTDAVKGDWYYEAVIAAKQAGIIHGFADGRFGANEAISRQDIAVMIEKAIAFVKAETNSVHFSSYLDEDDIADYAKNAVAKLSEAGVLQGMGGGKFAPIEQATRAQAAIIIYKVLGITTGLDM